MKKGNAFCQTNREIVISNKKKNKHSFKTWEHQCPVQSNNNIFQSHLGNSIKHFKASTLLRAPALNESNDSCFPCQQEQCRNKVTV